MGFKIICVQMYGRAISAYKCMQSDWRLERAPLLAVRVGLAPAEPLVRDEDHEALHHGGVAHELALELVVRAEAVELERLRNRQQPCEQKENK